MLEQLKDGSGVDFTIILNGKKESFKLAVIEDKSLFRDGCCRFAFVNEDCTKYVRSVYSGGATGFGSNKFDVADYDGTKINVITTDLDEIQKMAEAEEEDRKKKQEEYKAKMLAKAQRINDLPVFFPNPVDYGDKLFFTRSDASFHPERSGKIIGGTIRLVYLDARGEKADLFFERFISKDGKLMTKKFFNEVKGIIHVNETQAKWLLENLVDQHKDITNLIKNI